MTKTGQKTAKNNVLKINAAKTLAILFFLNLGVSIVLAAAGPQWPNSGTPDELAIGSIPGPDRSLNRQELTKIIKTSDNYTIAYWNEVFGSHSILKAQKYNSGGVAQWSPATGLVVYDGTALLAPIEALYTRFLAVPTTDGGAIFVWSDSRNSGNYDIYGVRINSDGGVHTDWESNGESLIASSYLDMVYDAIPDGADGVVLAYGQEESLLAPYIIAPYVQHINNQGETYTGWTADLGISVSDNYLPMTSSTGTSSTFHIVKYSAGYYVAYGYDTSNAKVSRVVEGNPPTIGFKDLSPFAGITTEDSQNRIAVDGSDNLYYVADSRTQRINSSGTLIYSTTGALSHNTGRHCQLAVDSGQTAPYAPIITCEKNVSGTNRIFAVKLDPVDGSIASGWNSGAEVQVNSGSGEATYPSNPVITTDSSDGAYIVWQDNRDGNVELYAQHLNSGGSKTFGASDLKVATQRGGDSLSSENIPFGDFLSSNNNIVLTSGTTFQVVWDNTIRLNEEDNVDNLIQILTSTDEGTRELTDAGTSLATQVATKTEQKNNQLVKTTDNNYVIAWINNETDDTYALFAEKLTITGTRLWNPDNPGYGKLLSSEDNADVGRDGFKIAADNDPSNIGGFLAEWYADPSGTEGIRVGKFNSDGDMVTGWAAGGSLIYEMSGTEPAGIISDSSGNIYTAFIKLDSPKVLYLAKINNADGNISGSWNSGSPVEVETGLNFNSMIRLVFSSGGSIIIAHENGDGLYIFNRYATDGTTVWEMPASINNYSFQHEFDMVSDGENGLIIIYQTENERLTDLEAQRITSAGLPAWNENGILIHSGTDYKVSPKIISDTATAPNGAVMVWADDRSGTFDIYAQRINADGITQWTTDGVAVSDTGDYLDQTNPAITENGIHGAIIAFTGASLTDNYLQIKSQNLNNFGEAVWTANGVTVENTDRYETNLNIAGDGNQGAVLSWDGTGDFVGGELAQWYLYDVFAQYAGDPNAPPAACTGVFESSGGAAFCARQTILEQTLSFTDIPDSFSFSPVALTGNVIQRFNNTTQETDPGIDDLLGVQDTRESGGFIVQLQSTDNFIEYVSRTKEIDINNCQAGDNEGSSCLYVTTATTGNYVIPGEPVEAVDGVIYQPSGQLEETIAAPVNAEGQNLTQAATYLNYGSELGNSTPVDLMNGTLPLTTGRNGNYYQYVNYYFKIPGFPALQPTPGNYVVILTFTLMESNS